MTDQHVYTIFKAEVPEGSVDELAQVAAKMSELTSREPGAVAYEWSLSEDKRRLHVYERFVNSEAGMAHLCQRTKRTDPSADIIVDPPPPFSGSPLAAQQPALAGFA